MGLLTKKVSLVLDAKPLGQMPGALPDELGITEARANELIRLMISILRKVTLSEDPTMSTESDDGKPALSSFGISNAIKQMSVLCNTAAELVWVSFYVGGLSITDETQEVPDNILHR